MWKPVVQVKVEYGTFKEYEQTTGKSYWPLPNEPILLEYRTEVQEGEPDKVVVVAIILSTEDQYRKRKFSYEEITELVLNGKDQKIIQMYRQAQQSRAFQDQVLNKK